MLTWLHIGDLHLTDPLEQNHRDLQGIVAAIGRLPQGAIDFVLLPGDNADDGEAAQFEMARRALAPLRLPVHILPGDHDYKPRNLDAFYRVLGARPLPYAASLHGTRCLFLDVVSAGSGGPDFRLGDDQLDWIEGEIAAAAAAGETVAVFMHTYPADLKAGASRLNALLAAPHVRCVDMGHTHYNELAHDGRTVFMATRSTGQIEEGPVGFSIAALDGGAVSWRFKPLADAWPFVLITSPADHRLRPDAAGEDASPAVLRAKVLADAKLATVEYAADSGPWQAMTRSAEDQTLWEAPLPRAAPAELRVRVRDAEGRQDEDTIEPRRRGAQPPRAADGSDRDRIGAWALKGLFDTQLGPNRNGRKW